MYTIGYLVDLESGGGWNELLAHKLIEETLNAHAWRNPKCKNLLCKPRCVVKPTRTNLLFSFNFWHLGIFPSFPMQAMGFLTKVYCTIKKDLGCMVILTSVRFLKNHVAQHSQNAGQPTHSYSKFRTQFQFSDIPYIMCHM
jgi:hypothetical protein